MALNHFRLDTLKYWLLAFIRLFFKVVIFIKNNRTILLQKTYTATSQNVIGTMDSYLKSLSLSCGSYIGVCTPNSANIAKYS